MNHHQAQQQQTMDNQFGSAGLTRYRSAPSSYFTTLLSPNPQLGENDLDSIFNPRATSPETQQILERFMNSFDPTHQKGNLSNTSTQSQSQPRFVQTVKSEPDQAQEPPKKLQRQQSNDYSSTMYQRLPDFSPGNLQHIQPMMKIGLGSSNLSRYNSSPAGLFASINIEELLANTGSGNRAKAEESLPQMRGFRSQKDFPPLHPSTSGRMAPIPETRPKGIRKFEENQDNDVDHVPNFLDTLWDESNILSDSFLKELGDNDKKTFSDLNVPSDDQSTDQSRARPASMLSHHLSLPKSPSELAAMEKLLQDSVPLRIRAKRGFATHPRSIAERVRRTKISERMRKLQDLVPNMERQTNTADMLDLAVDYIKDLQRQVKMLSDNHARCSCSAKHQPAVEQKGPCNLRASSREESRGKQM